MIHTDAQPAYWIVFDKQSYLVTRTDKGFALPLSPQPPVTEDVYPHVHLVGLLDGYEVKTYYLYNLKPSITPQNGQWIDLRASFDCVTPDVYRLAGKARQLVHWDMNTRFCPHCGVRTRQIAPIAKLCPQCQQEWYPHITTAIIVLIKKETSILLIRAKNFRGNYWGLVAGFVEPGESLEECVYREVQEETGLTIRNLHYWDSQTWPYPNGLMVAFTADYEAGEIKVQESELQTAAFFTKENLPEIPRKLSIARKLIDAWLNNEIE